MSVVISSCLNLFSALPVSFLCQTGYDFKVLLQCEDYMTLRKRSPWWSKVTLLKGNTEYQSQWQVCLRVDKVHHFIKNKVMPKIKVCFPFFLPAETTTTTASRPMVGWGLPDIWEWNLHFLWILVVGNPHFRGLRNTAPFIQT